MSDSLYIWYGLNDDAPWVWVLSDGDNRADTAPDATSAATSGAKTGSKTALTFSRSAGEGGQESGKAVSAADKAALALLGARDVSFIVPGQWVANHALDLPDLSGVDRLRAARFAIEHQLGQSLDRQHIVLNEIQRGSKRADVSASESLETQDVQSRDNQATDEPGGLLDAAHYAMVIAKDKLQAVIDAAKAASLSPQFIYADFDVLDKGHGGFRLGDRIVLPQERCTVDAGWESESDGAITRVNDGNLLSKYIDTSRATNLRAGAFTKRRDWAAAKRWVSAGQLIVLGGLVGIFALNLLGHKLAHVRAMSLQTAQVEALSGQIYTQVTGQPPSRDMARSLRVKLKANPSAGQSVSQDVSAVFDLLEAVDGVVLQTLRVSPDQKGVILRLNYPSFETSALLETLAKSKGLKFEARGVREQGGKLVGDAVFSRGGAT